MGQQSQTRGEPVKSQCLARIIKILSFMTMVLILYVYVINLWYYLHKAGAIKFESPRESRLLEIDILGQNL